MNFIISVYVKLCGKLTLLCPYQKQWVLHVIYIGMWKFCQFVFVQLNFAYYLYRDVEVLSMCIHAFSLVGFVSFVSVCCNMPMSQILTHHSLLVQFVSIDNGLEFTQPFNRASLFLHLLVFGPRNVLDKCYYKFMEPKVRCMCNNYSVLISYANLGYISWYCGFNKYMT